MVGTRARTSLVVATAMVAVAVPASAPGATTIGETSSAALLTCVADFNWVQDSTAPASPSYTVPAGGGVITSWQHYAANVPASTMRLKIFRKTGANAYLTVGHSAVEPLTSGGLKTFATRVSVQGGDLLGLRTGGDTTACFQTSVAGDLARNGDIGEPDPAIGDSVSFTFDDPEDRLNVAATVKLKLRSRAGNWSSNRTVPRNT